MLQVLYVGASRAALYVIGKLISEAVLKKLAVTLVRDAAKYIARKSENQSVDNAMQVIVDALSEDETDKAGA